MHPRTCVRTANPLSRFSRLARAQMPLRARISPGSLGASRNYAMEADILQNKAGDTPDDVLFDTLYGLRTIELNRPRKLNSLDGSMARKIYARLKEWEKSQLANVVVIKGAGRAFCAGGDVAALAKANTQGAKGQEESRAYFALEYKLDHLIATYSKPYVAFMDGITMGGGVGLSVHAPFRIATENTVFAMPETTIGFFPDVGASFFLPRMDGQLGTYLALTSHQLRGPSAYFHGVATHFVHSTSLKDLEERLAELTFKDYMTLNERYKIINSTIEEFVTGLPEGQPMQYTGAVREAVDRCFHPRHVHITDIIAALQREEGGAEERTWAQGVLKSLKQRSPTSLWVTLRLMRNARAWNIAEAFWHEYNIASHFMEHPDFTEGVTARLLEKRTPRWRPDALAKLSDPDIHKFFATPHVLQLLDTGKDSGYTEYPHAWIALPREEDVEALVRQGITYEDVMQRFEKEREGKIGVPEKVADILARKTRLKDDGFLAWIDDEA